MTQIAIGDIAVIAGATSPTWCVAVIHTAAICARPSKSISTRRSALCLHPGWRGRSGCGVPRPTFAPGTAMIHEG